MKTIYTFLLLTIFTQSFGQTLKDCSICSTQIIKAEQIKELSIDEIRFLTNDLFARKGYVFQDSDIDAYYSNKTWYKPVNANYTIEYNSIEKQNIKLFQEKTKELKAYREKLINELKHLKNLLDTNNKQELKRKFALDIEDNSNFIKNVTDEIFIEDINWFKKKGLYKVTKDNGDIVKEYILRVDGENVSFEFAIRGGSDIGNGDVIYPREYITEASYVYYFKFENGKLIFEKVIMAG